MPRKRGARLISIATLLGVLVSQRAYADEKQLCVSASEKAQQLRNAGRLSEAREQLVICGRVECPKLVQQDCTEWMREVLGMLPSVVPGAKDKDGRDLVHVKVSVDGKVVTETLDGKALGVDPGVHSFRFETANAPPIVEQVVVRQGEKNRILTVTFATPDDAKSAKSANATSDVEDVKEPKAVETGGSAPVAAYITGGVGLVALGAALYINLDANAEARELRSTCAPSCEQSQVDDIENRQVIAGVTAALGGAALIAGVVLFFTHDRVRSSASRFLPAVTPLSRGAAATAGFRF